MTQPIAGFGWLLPAVAAGAVWLAPQIEQFPPKLWTLEDLPHHVRSRHPRSISAGPDPGLFDGDPRHLWNRVHRQLHVRVAGGVEYGEDEVDPLLWGGRFLLSEPTHGAALTVLDEFLDSHGERLVTDRIKRAVFQHDLWAVFDWLAQPPYTVEEQALATRLAGIMRRVALSSEQIAQLPDNYTAAVRSAVFPERFDPRQSARAFLPPNMFDADGSWLDVSGSDAGPIAALHAVHFSHSEFSVLLNVPGGVVATLDYLEKLWSFAQPFVADPFRMPDGEQRYELNPALPPLPPGTQVALVRRMLLVDDAGRIARSRLTESVQLRVFSEQQRFFEFVTRRRALFGGQAGGFHAVGPLEEGFVVFSSHGIDPFEGRARPLRTRPLQTCVHCHGGPGIRSLRIAPRLLRPNPSLNYQDPRWRTYGHDAVFYKARRYDWGLLQGLWQTSPW